MFQHHQLLPLPPTSGSKCSVPDMLGKGVAAASVVLEIILLQNATLVTEGPERTTSALFSWPPRADFRHSPCEDPEAFAMTTMARQVQAGLGD